MLPGIKQKIHKSKAKKKSACSIRDTVTFETLSSLFLEIKKLIYKKKKQHLYDSKMHYINRLYKATTMIEEMIIPGPGIQFHVKEPCAIHKLQDFVQKELPKRRKKVAVDGLIFVPLEKNVSDRTGYGYLQVEIVHGSYGRVCG